MEYNVNKQDTIGTSSVVVSIEKNNVNVRRSAIIVINTSTGGQVITLGIDKEAVANQGITLKPGGTWQDSRDAGYLPTQKLITAIADGAGGLLSVYERVENGWDA